MDMPLLVFFGIVSLGSYAVGVVVGFLKGQRAERDTDYALSVLVKPWRMFLR